MAAESFSGLCRQNWELRFTSPGIDIRPSLPSQAAFWSTLKLYSGACEPQQVTCLSVKKTFKKFASVGRCVPFLKQKTKPGAFAPGNHYFILALLLPFFFKNFLYSFFAFFGTLITSFFDVPLKAFFPIVFAVSFKDLIVTVPNFLQP